MPTQRTTHSSKSKSKAAKTAAKAAPKAKKVAAAPVKAKAVSTSKPEPKREQNRDRDQHPRGEGAHATGPADFVVNRKWSGKTLEPRVGAHIRVELPENAMRGMSWQLMKLPHGVALDEAEVERISPPLGMHNQNRVFNFSVNEAGEYTLQFNLARFGQPGIADTFKLKMSARDERAN